MRVVVVWRDEDRQLAILRSPKKPFQVVDGSVLGNALADDAPSDALFTEEIVLRVGDPRGPCRRDLRRSQGREGTWRAPCLMGVINDGFKLGWWRRLSDAVEPAQLGV